MPQSGRGIVEERSLLRRQSAAKEAIATRTSSVYQQLLDKAPKAPVCGPKEADSQQRSFSAPVAKDNDNMDALPLSSPDSSQSGSGYMDSLSNISEAGDVGGGSAGDASPRGEEEVKDMLILPDEALDRIDLLSGSGSKNLSGSAPLAPRPGTAGSAGSELSEAGSLHSGRPGSNRHRVLPPIGQTVQALPDY